MLLLFSNTCMNIIVVIIVKSLFRLLFCYWTVTQTVSAVWTFILYSFVCSVSVLVKVKRNCSNVLFHTSHKGWGKSWPRVSAKPQKLLVFENRDAVVLCLYLEKCGCMCECVSKNQRGRVSRHQERGCICAGIFYLYL